MIKKNISGILIVAGIIFIYLCLQRDEVRLLRQLIKFGFNIKIFWLPLLYLALGIIFLVAGIRMQVNLKKKVEKKQLLDSLPNDN